MAPCVLGRVLCGGTPVLACLSLAALVLPLLSWRGSPFPLPPSGVTASYLYPLYGLLAVVGERPRVTAVYPFLYPFRFRCYPLSSCWFFPLLCALLSSCSPPWRDFLMPRGCFPFRCYHYYPSHRPIEGVRGSGVRVAVAWRTIRERVTGVHSARSVLAMCLHQVYYVVLALGEGSLSSRAITLFHPTLTCRERAGDRGAGCCGGQDVDV